MRALDLYELLIYTGRAYMGCTSITSCTLRVESDVSLAN